MPHSLPIFDEELELYFSLAQHSSVLDIGPGAGKYGKMLARVCPSTPRIAIELDSSYVETYGLRNIYDEVLVMDAARLPESPRQKFGAVIISDVIEHMPKSAGVDLLNFLVYRSHTIFVKFPLQMLQDDLEGHISEAHVSVWSELDFAGFDHIFVERYIMQMAVIRGYLSRCIEWLPREFVRRLGYERCADYYNEQPARWKRADRETLWRQQCEDDLRTLMHPDDRFVVIDEEQSGLLTTVGSRRIPFCEHDGQYWGMPANDADAMAELNRQITAGARWLVVTPNSSWAMAFYPELFKELRERHECALDNDRLTVFRLNGHLS